MAGRYPWRERRDAFVTPEARAEATTDPAPTCAERLDAVWSAVASQRMEGLEPDPAVVAELERAAREGTSFDAVVDAYLMYLRAGTA